MSAEEEATRSAILHANMRAIVRTLVDHIGPEFARVSLDMYAERIEREARAVNNWDDRKFVQARAQQQRINAVNHADIGEAS